MSASEKAAEFIEGLQEQFGQQRKQATDMWRGLHKQIATNYRQFLDKQLSEDTSMERDWTQRMTKMFMESIKAQREARAQFVESQRTMIDKYIEFIDKMDKEKDEESNGGDTEA